MQRSRPVPVPVGAFLARAASPLIAALVAAGCGGGGNIVDSPVAVASVSVSAGATTLAIGASTTATATLRDAAGNILTGRTLTWASSNVGVASVSQAGVILAVSVGSATITATSGNQVGSLTITVSPPPVASVTVVLALNSIAIGQTTTATATLRDASGNILTGRTITWTSSNNAVASVTSAGSVSGLSAGSANIIATSEGQSGQAALTVTGPAGACNISAALAAAPTLTVGQTVNGTLATTDCRLTDGSYVDWYRFVVTTTTTYQFDQASTAFDAFLILLDANGNAITSDDDTGGGTNARIVRSLAPGTYYVGANSFAAGSTGAYTLTAVVGSGGTGTACTLSSAPATAIGANINGTLTNTDCRLGDNSYVDYYRLVITTTVTVTIDMTSTAFDTWLWLLDANGNTITTDDDSGGGTNSRIVRSLTPGTYYIGANSFDANVFGAYLVTVR